jgi:hypothetical protein
MQVREFKIQREPYNPRPASKDSRTAKDEILAAGGTIFIFSVNGCSNIAQLETYLIDEYGLSDPYIVKALDVMASTTINGSNEQLKNVWGMREKLSGKDSTSFVGFSFNEEELEQKSKLFIKGVLNMKEYLETLLTLPSFEWARAANWTL